MRNTFITILLLALSSSFYCQTLTFTVTNQSPSYSITCNNPSVSLTASSNFTGSVTYIWSNGINSFTAQSVQLANTGNYTVTATSGTASGSQTLAIGINTAVPSSTINPIALNMTCNGTEPNIVTLMGDANLNITHNVIGPYGGTVSANTTTFNYAAGGPGTYTHVLIDNNSGCSITKIFTVTGSPGFPTFSITSSQNFSIGCGSNSIIAVNLTNGSTGPMPGGAVSYTVLSPGTGTAVNSTTLSAISSYTFNQPGTYTMVIRDNTSLCMIRIPITITAPSPSLFPSVSLATAAATLSCANPSVILQGSSTNTSAVLQWQQAGTPSVVPGASIIVLTNTAVNSSTIVNTFTFVAMHPTQGCKTSSTVTVYQNIFSPIASVTSMGQITCITPTVVLTNVSSSGIPASVFSNTAPVVAIAWVGPPVNSQPVSSTYTASVGGMYTLTVQDQNNGCTSSATINVNDSRIYPNMGSPQQAFNLCSTGTVNIAPILPNPPPQPAYSYSWTAPAGATLSNSSSATVTANQAGTYTIIATNQMGCSVVSTVQVVYCVGLSVREPATFINIYPVPANDRVFIKGNWSEDITVRVINTIGQQVLISQLNEERSLSIEALTRGLYFIEIKSKNAIIYSGRMIKE